MKPMLSIRSRYSFALAGALAACAAGPTGDAPAALDTPPVASRGADRSEADRPDEAESGPHGRVVHAESGEPVEGVAIRLAFARRTIAETTTDTEGRFRFERPERPHRRVAVATSAWESTERPVLLDDPLARGERAIRIEVLPVEVAPLSGVLVDEATGEPIPRCAILLTGPVVYEDPTSSVLPPSDERRLVTDGAGRFAADEPLPPGTYYVSRGDSLTYHQVEHAKGSQANDVSVSVGPTYRLDPELPRGIEAGDLVAIVPSVAGPPRSARIRAGEPPWVRFPDPIRAPAAVRIERPGHDASGFAFQVRSRDGRWIARATVDSVEGLHADVVPLRFERAGLLHGTVTAEDGEPVREGSVEVHAQDSSVADSRRVELDADGAFRAHWLTGSEWFLRVDSTHFEPWTTTVSIDPGACNELEATLEPTEPLGVVSGVVRGMSGEWSPDAGLSVELAPLDPRVSRHLAEIQLRRNGDAWSAPFAFPHVPVGEYLVSVRSTRRNLAWRRARARVTAPNSDVEFVYDDETPTTSLLVRPTSAEDGRRLGAARTLLWFGDRGRGVQFEPGRPHRFHGLPRDGEFEWIVHARGHRLARGDESAFAREEGRLVLDVALEPGWGRVFRAVDEATGLPVEGVALHADGELVGRTDAEGIVLLDRERMPERVDFHRGGWRLLLAGRELESWKRGPDGATLIRMGHD